MDNHPTCISFRPLTEADFPLMQRWLNTPHISRWYMVNNKRNPSLGEVRRHWLPRIHGKDPTKAYIVYYKEKPIGSIQCALYDDNPEWKAAYGFNDNMAGIDIFIGKEEYLHKGLGAEIIRIFLREIVFVIYDVKVCTIDPEPENKIAIRAYEKAGFRHMKTTWNPIDRVYAYLMEIQRDAVCQSADML